MKEYLKNNFKNLPFIIVVFILLYSITTYATEVLFTSTEVSYDNTNSGMSSRNVQGAIDELYGAATNYVTYNGRLQLVFIYEFNLYKNKDAHLKSAKHGRRRSCHRRR